MEIHKRKINAILPLCCENQAIVSKKFRSGYPGRSIHIRKFPPGYQDLGRKNRDIIGNRASPAVSHMKHRKFYEGKSAEARSPYLTFLQNCLILHFTFLPLTNLKTLYSNLDGSLSLFLHVSALRLLVSFLRSKHWKDCLLLRV